MNSFDQVMKGLNGNKTSKAGPMTPSLPKSKKKKDFDFSSQLSKIKMETTSEYYERKSLGDFQGL